MEAFAAITCPRNVGIAGTVVSTGTSLLIVDVENSNFNPKTDSREGAQGVSYQGPTKSIVAVPMRNTAGTIIGVMELTNPPPELIGPLSLIGFQNGEIISISMEMVGST